MQKGSINAAVTSGKGDICIAGIPMPEPGDYQCLCKICACATCTGTDAKIISGSLPFEVPYPSVFGHESVGKVVKKGRKARHINEGDMFLRPTAVYPGEKIGEYYSSWGCYAEYGLITDIKAFSEDFPGKEFNQYIKYQQQIPGDILLSAPDATMLVTLKEASSFISGIGVHMDSSVLILGSGPVAKSMCYFAKLLGAGPVIVLGRRKEPLRWAADAGCDFTINIKEEDMVQKVMQITAQAGVDFCVDTTGSPELVIEALKTLSPHGRIAPYATYPDKDSFKGQDPEKFLSAGPREDRAHDYLIFLLRRKQIDLRSFYTHLLPFAEIREGFQMIKDKAAYKIVFEMES